MERRESLRYSAGAESGVRAGSTSQGKPSTASGKSTSGIFDRYKERKEVTMGEGGEQRPSGASSTSTKVNKYSLTLEGGGEGQGRGDDL